MKGFVLVNGTGLRAAGQRPGRVMIAVLSQTTTAPSVTTKSGSRPPQTPRGSARPAADADAPRMPNIARNVRSALDEGHSGYFEPGDQR